MACSITASPDAHPGPAGPSGLYHDRGERYEGGIKLSPPSNILKSCFPLPTAWSRSAFQAYGSPVNLVKNRSTRGEEKRGVSSSEFHFSPQSVRSPRFDFNSILFLSTIRVSSPSRWSKEVGPGVCIGWLLSATSSPLGHLFRPRSGYSHVLHELP